jgi:hypothetical protein
MQLKVLFIGNSHTYLHYMPQMLVHLVQDEDRGFDLEVDQSTGEGASLQWHWHNESTRKKISSREWDYIVLQDRSGGPLEEFESFQKHARLLNAEIQNAGATTIMYMTWANLSRPETQTLLTEAYRRMAVELGAELAPVGLAWRNVIEAFPGIELHHKDGRHASPAGAYLTACVFFTVLTGTSPEGLPASFFIEGKQRPDQNRAQALLLQEVAGKSFLESKLRK